MMYIGPEQPDSFKELKKEKLYGKSDITKYRNYASPNQTCFFGLAIEEISFVMNDESETNRKG